MSAEIDPLDVKEWEVIIKFRGTENIAKDITSLQQGMSRNTKREGFVDLGTTLHQLDKHACAGCTDFNEHSMLCWDPAANDFPECYKKSIHKG